MRIGLDARLWQETGVGRYTRALIAYLPKLLPRHELILFVRKADVATATQTCKGWEIREADVAWHSLQEQMRLPELFKKADLDLLHIPYFSVPLTLSIPFIVTIHDLIISHRPTGRATTKSLPVYLSKRLAYKLVLSRAISNARSIITVSHTVQQQIIAAFPASKDKVFVTHESGELEKNRGTAQTLKDPYLLYVGNAHPHKNLESLLCAFELLSNSFLRLQLVFIGKADFFYERLKEQIKNKPWADRVHFIGAVESSALSSWYKNAELFVFPSLEEGFGIPGLEAMHLGCPVAASDILVFREIYGTAAVYFNPQSSSEMARVISEVLSSRAKRQKLVEKGFARAHVFSWEKMAQETARIYENSIHLRSHQ